MITVGCFSLFITVVMWRGYGKVVGVLRCVVGGMESYHVTYLIENFLSPECRSHGFIGPKKKGGRNILAHCLECSYLPCFLKKKVIGG